MLSSVGWSEIIFILVLALILVGPERLPGLIEDIRAGLIAARRAIDNVKAEMRDEVGDLREFAKPLGDIAAFSRMGPKAAITRTLLDGDSSLFDSLEETSNLARHGLTRPVKKPKSPLSQPVQPTRTPPGVEQPPTSPETNSPASRPKADGSNPGKPTWEDIT